MHARTHGPSASFSTHTLSLSYLPRTLDDLHRTAPAAGREGVVLRVARARPPRAAAPLPGDVRDEDLRAEGLPRMAENQ